MSVTDKEIIISGKVKTFDMDYFGRKEAIATIEGGYRIHFHSDGIGYYTLFDLYKKGERIFSYKIPTHAKWEYFHLLRGKLKARFYVRGSDHQGRLHELILPHDVGKLCTIKNLSGE
jgi:hypothetical protein